MQEVFLKIANSESNLLNLLKVLTWLWKSCNYVHTNLLVLVS